MTVPVPSINQCLNYIDRHGMLDNIRAHSFKVARVAELLVDGLSKANGSASQPPRELVIAGALLHDIAKIADSFFLETTVTGVSQADNRELVQAIAKAASQGGCGGNCDCGC